MLKIDFNNPIIFQDMKEIDERLSEHTQLYGKSIFITGAAGMIASYVIAYFMWLNEFHNANIQIYAGIRNEKKAFSRFGELSEKDYFHLINQNVITPIMYENHFDYIIHAASLASAQYYGKQPVETMLPNVIGTYNLLEYSRLKPVQGFLFLSSGAIYGNVENSDKRGIDETNVGTLDYFEHGCKYAESKRCGEALCHAYWSEYNVPATMARITHTYGPTMDLLEDKRVFAEFVNNIIQHQNIKMKSDGSAVRQFCYITDTVIALLKVLLIGERGITYNVGNDKELLSISELANVLVSLFPERRLKIERGVRSDSGYAPQNTSDASFVSVEKVRGLGWEPLHSVNDGFQRVVEAIEYQKVK